MKVLFFIDSMTAGGKERRLTELMKSLRLREGFQFELVVMDNEVHYKEVLDLDINIHYLVRKRKKDFSMFKKIYKLCKDFNPDIVHCWDSMTAFYLAPICKLLRFKLINGMVVDSPVKQNILNTNWFRARLTFPFSNVIIGNSLAGLKAYHAPKSKSVCVYNGFNFERLKKVEESQVIRTKFNIKAKYVVLMVGAFGERKDYDTYIASAIIVCNKRNDIEFISVGGGEDFARISEKIRLSAFDRIKLLGTQSDVESIVNISDICVLTTNSSAHGEGISNSILEYMAMGKAVIASSGGGTNEIVVDKKTGFLINPSSPLELSEKIELLLNDAELRNEMGIAGKKRIEENFSIDKMVDKFISIYTKATKKV